MSDELGNRFNSGKVKWSLVPMKSLEPMVRALEFGAKRYGAHNWEKGLSAVETCESLQRHLNSYLSGEDLDPESGISHIGHILCNGLFLSHLTATGKIVDDRNKYIHLLNET